MRVHDMTMKHRMRPWLLAQNSFFESAHSENIKKFSKFINKWVMQAQFHLLQTIYYVGA